MYNVINAEYWSENQILQGAYNIIDAVHMSILVHE
jgi:hypothetical protein